MIDAAKIEELRGLLTKATPGPWVFEEIQGSVADGCGYIRREDHDRREISHHGDMNRVRSENISNASLIVAMRNALPELLDLAISTLANESKGGDANGAPAINAGGRSFDATSPDSKCEPVGASVEELCKRLLDFRRENGTLSGAECQLTMEAASLIRRLERELRSTTFSRDTWRKTAEDRKGVFELQAVERRATTAEAEVADLRGQLDAALSMIALRTGNIDALAAEVERLRAALRPFARQAKAYDADPTDLPTDETPLDCADYINVGDLRRARSELEGR